MNTDIQADIQGQLKYQSLLMKSEKDINALQNSIQDLQKKNEILKDNQKQYQEQLQLQQDETMQLKIQLSQAKYSQEQYEALQNQFNEQQNYYQNTIKQLNHNLEQFQNNYSSNTHDLYTKIAFLQSELTETQEQKENFQKLYQTCEKIEQNLKNDLFEKNQIFNQKSLQLEEKLSIIENEYSSLRYKLSMVEIEKEDLFSQNKLKNLELQTIQTELIKLQNNQKNIEMINNSKKYIDMENQIIQVIQQNEQLKLQLNQNQQSQIQQNQKFSEQEQKYLIQIEQQKDIIKEKDQELQKLFQQMQNELQIRVELSQNNIPIKSNLAIDSGLIESDLIRELQSKLSQERLEKSCIRAELDHFTHEMKQKIPQLEVRKKEYDILVNNQSFLKQKLEISNENEKQSKQKIFHQQTLIDDQDHQKRILQEEINHYREQNKHLLNINQVLKKDLLQKDPKTDLEIYRIEFSNTDQLFYDSVSSLESNYHRVLNQIHQYNIQQKNQVSHQQNEALKIQLEELQQNISTLQKENQILQTNIKTMQTNDYVKSLLEIKINQIENEDQLTQKKLKLSDLNHVIIESQHQIQNIELKNTLKQHLQTIKRIQIENYENQTLIDQQKKQIEYQQVLLEEKQSLIKHKEIQFQEKIQNDSQIYENMKILNEELQKSRSQSVEFRNKLAQQEVENSILKRFQLQNNDQMQQKFDFLKNSLNDQQIQLNEKSKSLSLKQLQLDDIFAQNQVLLSKISFLEEQIQQYIKAQEIQTSNFKLFQNSAFQKQSLLMKIINEIQCKIKDISPIQNIKEIIQENPQSSFVNLNNNELDEINDELNEQKQVYQSSLEKNQQIIEQITNQFILLDDAFNSQKDKHSLEIQNYEQALQVLQNDKQTLIDAYEVLQVFQQQKKQIENDKQLIFQKEEFKSMENELQQAKEELLLIKQDKIELQNQLHSLQQNSNTISYERQSFMDSLKNKEQKIIEMQNSLENSLVSSYMKEKLLMSQKALLLRQLQSKPNKKEQYSTSHLEENNLKIQLRQVSIENHELKQTIQHLQQNNNLQDPKEYLKEIINLKSLIDQKEFQITQLNQEVNNKSIYIQKMSDKYENENSSQQVQSCLQQQIIDQQSTITNNYLELEKYKQQLEDQQHICKLIGFEQISNENIEQNGQLSDLDFLYIKNIVDNGALMSILNKMQALTVNNQIKD